MRTRLRQVLAAPVFEDEGMTRAASLLNTSLLTLLVAATLIPPSLVFVDPTGTTVTLLGGAVVAATAVGLLVLMRRGHVRTASILLSSILFVLLTGVIYSFGVIHDYTVTVYFLVICIAGLLLGGRAAITFGALCMLATVGVFYAELGGIIVPFETPIGVTDLIIVVTGLGSTALLLRFAVRSIDEGFARARSNAQALAETNRELQASHDALQAQARDLARRTRYLEATAEVARDAASVLDPQELLSRVVTLVSERFGFYHAGIFLVDETGEWAVLQAASSEGGQRMLARRHRLRVGEEGVVGYVTGRGQPRIALDVGEDAVFFDNADMPDTRSEMALPLRVRDEIIGALDVQSTEPAAFSDEDVAVLQTLADQVIVAISNARLFEQVQESLEAVQRAYGESSHEGWRKQLRTQPNLGFFRDKRGIVPASDLWQPEMETAPGPALSAAEGPALSAAEGPALSAAEGPALSAVEGPALSAVEGPALSAAEGTDQTTPGKDGATRLAMPIRVRGYTIGTIDARKPDDAGQWTSEEIALLETLSDQLGVALESARLYQDAHRRAARERLTSEITDKMRRAPDIDGLMQTAIQEISAALGTSRIFVQLSTSPDPAGAGDKNGTSSPSADE